MWDRIESHERQVGRAAWVLLAVCWAYILVAVVLPLLALLLTSSFQL